MSSPHQPKIVVLKFGGTSVSSAACWQTIYQQISRLRAQNHRPVVVCSALSGISNQLAELATAVLNHGDQSQAPAVQQFATAHEQLCHDLKLPTSLIQSSIARLKQYITTTTPSSTPPPSTGLPPPALKAKIMALGEYTLSTIGHAYLNLQGLNCQLVDAGEWLKSRHPDFSASDYGLNEHFLSASCDYTFDPELRQHCLNSNVDTFITQGFIATDHNNHTVLLGRGGSDTSATCLAAKLNATAVEIWTDVPGIFTANPKEIHDSRLLLQLSYEEAQELASSGAKVLHPRCIEPISTTRIPLSIRWTQYPQLQPTTTIGPINHSGYNVKGICSKKHIYVFSMDSIKMWQQAGFLADIFTLFKQFHLSCDTVSTSETNITVTVNTGIQTLDDEALSQLKHQLSQICRLTIFRDCVSISLVGQGIRSILHRLAPLLKVFEDRKVFVVSQAANNLNLSFTVQSADAHDIMMQLHKLLFSETTDPQLHIFGATWQQINHQARQSPSPSPTASPPSTSSELLWWQEYRDILHNMVHQQTDALKLPAYIYHLPTVIKRATELNNITTVDQIFYALKANPHPQIITALEQLGFGFDCVSYGEIEHLKTHLSHFNPQRIIFTPNFAPITEYIQAFDDGVTVTVDNLELLKTHPQVFAHQKIMVRIDLDTRDGHHPYVKTAGDDSKFGIPRDDWHPLIALLKEHQIMLQGIHSHQGSGVSKPTIWANTARSLIQLAQTIPEECRSPAPLLIDLGGGFPVVEKPEHSPPFCPSTFNAALAQITHEHPEYVFAIEPGRYLVAEAGIILTQVHQLKTKHQHHYIGVDAGMHTLIRPALYGAYHHISHLKSSSPHSAAKPDPAATMIIADIVGPICESGDVLAKSRLLSQPQPQDILVICGAGAYGRMMASNYNQRGLPTEHLITEPQPNSSTHPDDNKNEIII